jgi:hypothetical protein
MRQRRQTNTRISEIGFTRVWGHGYVVTSLVEFAVFLGNKKEGAAQPFIPHSKPRASSA